MPVDFRPTEGYIVSQAFDVAQSFKANELGTVALFRDAGSTDYGSAFFKYVKYEFGDVSTGLNGVDKYVTYYHKLNGYKTHIVSCDVSDSVFSAAIVIGAGVLHSAPTDGQYVWIQQTGPATPAVNLAGSPTDGVPLTGVGAADGGLDVVDTSTIVLANVNVCAYAGDDSENEIICAFLL